MAQCCQLFSGVGDSLESQPATPGFQRHTAWPGGSWQQMLSEGERCAAGERGPCKGQGRMASRGMAQCGWEPGCFILWVALCPQRVRAVTPSGPLGLPRCCGRRRLLPADISFFGGASVSPVWHTGRASSAGQSRWVPMAQDRSRRRA